MLVVASLASLAQAAGPEPTFRDRYAQLMRQWKSGFDRLNQAPRPRFASLSREDLRRMKVARVERIAQIHRAAEARTRATPATPKYTRLKALTLDFFAVQARGAEEYARLLRSNSPKAEGYAKIDTRRTYNALRAMITEVERVENRPGAFQKRLEEARRRIVR